MSEKAPDAFRTISEAAGELDVPAHTLRHWETLFPQIKPMRRSGGRRYYRPRDLQLLSGIRHLLEDEGYSVAGLRRLLREQGVGHVAGLGRTAGETGTPDHVIVPTETLRLLMADLAAMKAEIARLRADANKV